MADCTEATARASTAARNAAGFVSDAIKARSDAKAALADAEDAANQAEAAAKRVADATKRTVEDAKSLTSGSAFACASGSAHAPAPTVMPPMPIPSGPSFPSFPGMRATDEITAAVAQLNSLVVGATPAFATAMRLSTDAMASGIASQNAVSHQANQNMTALLLQVRASANLVGKG